MKKKFYCVAVSRNDQIVSDLCKCPAVPNDVLAALQLMRPSDVCACGIVDLDVSPETGEPNVTSDVYLNILHLHE